MIDQKPWMKKISVNHDQERRPLFSGSMFPRVTGNLRFGEDRDGS